MEEQQRRRNMQNEVAGVVKEGAVAKKSVVDGVAKHTHGLVSMAGLRREDLEEIAGADGANLLILQEQLGIVPICESVAQAETMGKQREADDG